MSHTFFSLFITLFVTGAFAQSDGWVLEEVKNEVEIYSKVEQETGREWIRLSTIVPASFEQVVTYSADISKAPEWVYSCKETEVYLDTAKETLYRSVTDLPFPMSDRYALVRKAKYMDDDAGTFTSISTNYTEKSIETDYVRVTDFQAIWVFEDVGANKTKITYDLYTSVDLPDWIQDKVKRYGPYRTLLSLKEKFQFEMK